MSASNRHCNDIIKFKLSKEKDIEVKKAITSIYVSSKAHGHDYKIFKDRLHTAYKLVGQYDVKNIQEDDNESILFDVIFIMFDINRKLVKFIELYKFLMLVVNITRLNSKVEDVELCIKRLEKVYNKIKHDSLKLLPLQDVDVVSDIIKDVIFTDVRTAELCILAFKAYLEWTKVEYSNPTIDPETCEIYNIYKDVSKKAVTFTNFAI